VPAGACSGFPLNLAAGINPFFIRRVFIGAHDVTPGFGRNGPVTVQGSFPENIIIPMIRGDFVRGFKVGHERQYGWNLQAGIILDSFVLQFPVPSIGPEADKHQVVGMDAKKVGVRHGAGIDGEHNRRIECFQVFRDGRVKEFVCIILGGGNHGLPIHIAVVAVIDPDDPILSVFQCGKVGQVFIQGLEIGSAGLEEAIIAIIGADPFLGDGTNDAAAFGFGIFFIDHIRGPVAEF